MERKGPSRAILMRPKASVSYAVSRKLTAFLASPFFAADTL